MPGATVLAGKSTLNHLEHAPVGGPGRYSKVGHDDGAIEGLFVDLFLEAHDRSPGGSIRPRPTIRCSAIDGVGSFYSYYDCYVRLLRRHLLCAMLGRSNIDAEAGGGGGAVAGALAWGGLSWWGRMPASPARR